MNLLSLETSNFKQFFSRAVVGAIVRRVTRKNYSVIGL